MSDASPLGDRTVRAVPKTHRLLLRLYPRWFRTDYGVQLAEHLAHQRAEPRYAAWVLGAARFWWDAGIDAVATGVKLRLGGVGDGWKRLWRGRRHESDRGRLAHGGDLRPERGGVGPMLDAILRDVRHAMRALARNPGYACVFILTLGLGIGANTAMFSAVNGVLLRPLPHNDGERLVYLRHTAPRAGVENALFSVPEIDDYRQGSPSLQAVAEFSALTFTMLGLDTPHRVRAGIVTGNYFEVMGLSATLGRTVGREDDGEDAPAVIVLSDAYWRSFFGADPEILGKTVEMNGVTAMFVGVAEPAPPYPEKTDIYVNMSASPHHLDASMNHDRVHRMTEVFARMAPGATVESVRAEAAMVTTRIHADHADAYDAGSGYGVTVTPLKTQLTSRARPTLLLLLGTSFFVLIIACANLANLTLTRVLRRDHELAIRVSLGSSRAALRRGLLVESLVLAGGGAALGLVIASVGLDLLIAFAERFTSRASEISLDASVFGFALLAAVAASVFFTMVPTLPDGDRAGNALTRSGTRSVGSRAKTAQRALVVAQIGTSFLLLIGAGLFLRTMVHLNRVDLGFDTQVLTMEVPASFTNRTPDQIRNHYEGMRDEVAALPAVESAALTSSVPLSDGSNFGANPNAVRVQGQEPAPGAATPTALFQVVSPGYFATMGIEIIRGRDFMTTDLPDQRGVVIINESMAKAYFDDGDPIGQRIAWSDAILSSVVLGEEWRTVVGVARDTKDKGLDTAAPHLVYNPYGQTFPYYMESLVVRLREAPAAIMPAIRGAVLALDVDQPIANVATIADLRDESVAPRRLNTMLLGAFALLALVIAAVGIGGVLAFSVGSRRREFGVRSALGAARHQIWSGVLAEGALLAGVGVVLGTLAAVFLTRFVSGLLFGVPALDPVTFLAVGLLLGGVAIVAAWVPAWRAAAVSPMEALRAD